MSTQTTTVCDFCGATKKEVNHWYKVVIYARGRFAVIPADAFRPEGTTVADACGMQCCTQALARWMNHGTLESDEYGPVRMDGA